MAAPTYATDLTLAGHQLTLAESTTDGGTWAAIGGGNIALGAGPDFSMQGTNCVDAKISNTNKGPGVPVTSFSPGANDHIFGWVFLATPGLSATLQNEGLCVVVGTTVSNFVKFHVEGSDTYGAAGRVAKCYPVRYVTSASAVEPYRTVTGSPGATPSFVGATTSIAGTVKGSNIGVDAFRYGTGIYITAGDSGTPANLINCAAQNDAVANRWGVLTRIAGSNYELQGRIVIGQNTSQVSTAAYFVDQNKNILLVDTPHTLTDFTQIIVDNAGTTFNLTNVTIEAGGTNNPGKLVYNTTPLASTLSSCNFVAIGETVLRSGVITTGCSWRRSGQVTLNGATMTGCTFSNSPTATALLAGSSVSTLSNTTFVSVGTGHAIEITGGTSHTLNNITFTGYAASNGSTGNEALYVNIPSGTVNISADSALSYRTAGATVNLTVGQKTLSVTDVVSGSDIVILSAGTTTVLSDNDGATNPVTSFDYSYSYSAGTFVDIAIYKAGYVPYVVRNFELPSTGGSVKAAQVVDRNYTP